MVNEYEKQANDFMEKHGLEFRSVLIGNDCPTFCQDAENDIDMDKLNVYPRRTHIHGKHYRCTFSRKGKGHFSVDFWNSYNDEEFNSVRGHFASTCTDYKTYEKHQREMARSGRKAKTPTPYDVLACLTKYDPGTFENFCADYGYDTDSRKAEQTYHAVVKEWGKVARFFTQEELAEAQDIN